MDRHLSRPTIHLKAQVDRAGLCAADVHGYIGQGEVAFAAIEVNASVQLRVERSEDWLVDWPLIETEDEIMLFCSDTNMLSGSEEQSYVDVVREAYRAIRQVVAARVGGTIEEVNSVVATALDIRNCAIYGLGDYVRKDGKTEQPDRDIAIVASQTRQGAYTLARRRRREYLPWESKRFELKAPPPQHIAPSKPCAMRTGEVIKRIPTPADPA